ncbi:MAG: hypothetical protein RR435_07510 [Erysipelotrichaceae bacterium]
MVVMGIFSTGIDLIPLGSILKSCNTVKSLAVAATKDIVTSEAIGYTNSFMASYGAPPSSLIIMNLLATSVFTNYNKVSSIKDLDGIQPKVNSTNIEYIDDALSGKTKTMIGDNNDGGSIEKAGTNISDIKANIEKQNVNIKDDLLKNKGIKGADDFLSGMNAEDAKKYELWNHLRKNGLDQAKINDFILTNKGFRKNPSEYLYKEYIDTHLSKFKMVHHLW